MNPVDEFKQDPFSCSIIRLIVNDERDSHNVGLILQLIPYQAKPKQFSHFIASFEQGEECNQSEPKPNNGSEIKCRSQRASDTRKKMKPTTIKQSKVSITYFHHIISLN